MKTQNTFKHELRLKLARNCTDGQTSLNQGIEEGTMSRIYFPSKQKQSTPVRVGTEELKATRPGEFGNGLYLTENGPVLVKNMQATPLYFGMKSPNVAP